MSFDEQVTPINISPPPIIFLIFLMMKVSKMWHLILKHNPGETGKGPIPLPRPDAL